MKIITPILVLIATSVFLIGSWYLSSHTSNPPQLTTSTTTTTLPVSGHEIIRISSINKGFSVPASNPEIAVTGTWSSGLTYNTKITINGKNLTIANVGSGSNSMSPFFNSSSVVIVEMYPKRIEIGDVVSFKDGDEYLLHRVYSFDGNCYWTSGDNNLYADVVCVTPGMIVQKVVGVIYGRFA